MNEELKTTAMEVVAHISKCSYKSEYHGLLIVDINETLNKLLDKLEELSRKM